MALDPESTLVEELNMVELTKPTVKTPNPNANFYPNRTTSPPPLAQIDAFTLQSDSKAINEALNIATATSNAIAKQNLLEAEKRARDSAAKADREREEAARLRREEEEKIRAVLFHH